MWQIKTNNNLIIKENIYFAHVYCASSTIHVRKYNFVFTLYVNFCLIRSIYILFLYINLTFLINKIYVPKLTKNVFKVVHLFEVYLSISTVL